ncbi:hypothetical protein [Corynebacterium striatum]|uniref:hypothetical protein n=1 Tax=Corynebacterium striatum TaxID=43770 RepID=UPI000673C91A|nr:hypothetical protein [Corynebacterium striatum]EGT5592628.1 hypothetical protein [Corynebacterium striatum]MDK8882786.1 hypothetical protein [Corynebacterium striatum]CQD04280.1 conserved exported hypothetical protein [Corynebacterium striatum]HAT1277295.1 hypothetical protein [Corynebacterium striatum]HAT1290792.1 hypothetical protein [Corynebacterium striatum]
MKTQSKALASLASIAILFASQGLASAAEKDDPTTPQEFQEQTVAEGTVTPEVLDQAFEELINSDVPRTVNDDSTVTFDLEHMDLTLRDPHAITPYVSGGKENGGFWVEFTPLEQDMIISGSGFALGPPSAPFPVSGGPPAPSLEPSSLGQQ